MKKVIATKFLVICPKCDKPAIVCREFDDNTAQCIHKQNGNNIMEYCKITLKDVSDVKECLGCGKPQSKHPAISRYNHGDICSNCGMREALEGNFIKNK